MANTYVRKIADLNRDLSDGFAHTAPLHHRDRNQRQVDSEGNPYNSALTAVSVLIVLTPWPILKI